MNLLYCGDARIADGLLLSVLSLLRCVPEPLHVHLLTAGITTPTAVCAPLPPHTAEALRRLVQAVDPRSTVTLHDITALFTADPPVANLATRFTPCCMLRLYADLVPGLPDRLLYLDNDVVCRGDLTSFYGQDLTACEIVGVPDYYGQWLFRGRRLRRDYVNSGVLLLNMREIRRTGLFARCRARCRDRRMFMPDQSALNKLAVAKRLAPRRYNEQRRLQEDTVLQHFTTSFRFFPWFHAVSVKPWDVERVHSVLQLHAYDDLLDQYQELKGSFV